MKAALLSLVFLIALSYTEKPKPEDFDLTTPFEKGNGNQTPTYDEVMAYYEGLDAAYVSIKTYKIGRTDSGEPLTLVTANIVHGNGTNPYIFWCFNRAVGQIAHHHHRRINTI